MVKFTSKEFTQKFAQLRGLLNFPVDHSRLNTWEDYQAVAQRALWKAYNTFEEGRNTRFDTYAVRCMRNAIFNEHKKTLTAQGTMHREMQGAGLVQEEELARCGRVWMTEYFGLGEDEELRYTRIYMLTRFALYLYMPDSLRVFDHYWKGVDEPSVVSRELGLPYRYVLRVVYQALSCMKLLFGLAKVYSFSTLLVYIDSVGITLPALPKCIYTHLTGGRFMAVTQKKLTEAQFKEVFSGHTEHDLIEEKWHTEFGVQVREGAAPGKGPLLNAMYGNYCTRYDEGVDLMEKEVGADPGVATGLGGDLVGREVTVPADDDGVVYQVTGQEGNKLTIQGVEDEEAVYEVSVDEVDVVEAEEPEEEAEEGITALHLTATPVEHSRVTCPGDGDGVVYTVQSIDGDALTIQVEDGEDTYVVTLDDVELVAGEEDEGEPEDPPEAEPVRETAEGDMVWCDEDGEDVLYKFVSVIDEVATVADEDGNEYDVPIGEVHVVALEEAAEEEAEEEAPQGPQVGDAVWCDEDGEDFPYTITEIKPDGPFGTATLDDGDGGVFEDIPCETVHVIEVAESEEGGEEEPEGEDDGSMEGKTVTVPADGDGVEYEVMAQDGQKLIIKNPEGDQYEVGVKDVDTA